MLLPRTTLQKFTGSALDCSFKGTWFSPTGEQGLSGEITWPRAGMFVAFFVSENHSEIAGLLHWLLGIPDEEGQWGKADGFRFGSRLVSLVRVRLLAPGNKRG